MRGLRSGDAAERTAQDGDLGVPWRAASVPMGRHDSVPSAITGAPLTYFTPSPLGELLERHAPPPNARSFGFGASAADHCLILLRSASLSGGRVVDVEQARRLGGSWLQPPAFASLGSLVALARSISPRVAGLREEISFVGGATASQAKHIFAPASALPGLTAELVQTLSAETSGYDGAALAALVGFWAVHAHPFADGNGRWSRTLALSAGARSDARAAMAAAVFLSVENQLLCERIWPGARRSGAVRYLDAVAAFERALFERLDAMPRLSALLSEAHATVRAAARGSKRLSDGLLVQLHAEGGLALSELAARCGLSARVAAGAAQRMRDAGLLDGRPGAERIDIAEPLALAATAVAAASAAVRTVIQQESRNEP